jgi:hypothetical protein
MYSTKNIEKSADYPIEIISNMEKYETFYVFLD